MQLRKDLSLIETFVVVKMVTSPVHRIWCRHLQQLCLDNSLKVKN